MTYTHQSIAAYSSESVNAAEYASPHQLTTMLFEGALKRISQARGAMDQGLVATKGERIGKAISIIEALRASLDHDVGGQISTNLDALYRYMEERLLVANLRNEGDALEEVGLLLQELKSGWDGISSGAKESAVT